MKRRSKKYLPLAMAAIFFAGTASVSQTAFAAYSDTEGHWAEDTIARWKDEGYISGYADGTFRPNQSISRMEFVILANKAFGFSASEEISFQDVAPSYWGYGEIQKAVAAGYIYGDDVGMFHPDDQVTRQEAAAMLARINHLPISDELSAQYADDTAIADWAKPYVEAVTKAGIMSGFPDGSFDPQTGMTRAEGVTSMDKAVSTRGTHGSGSHTVAPSEEAVDYTLTENILRDIVVEGDLILPSSLGGEEIVLENVTVKGTVQVQGGGEITAQGCAFASVELNKSGVVFSAESGTSVDRLEFLKKGTIQGQGYDTVIIAEDSVTEAIIDGTVETVELSTDANVKLYQDAAVDTLDITEDADGGKTTFSKGASVEDMNIRGEVRISGEGDVANMTVYVPGITSSVKPDNVEVKEDGKTPSYTGESASKGGGSSSGGSSGGNKTQPVLNGIQGKTALRVEESITLTADTTGEMTGYSIEWTVSDDTAASLSPTTGDTVTLTGQATGSVTVTAALKNSGGSTIASKTMTVTIKEKFVAVTGITIAEQSVALGKELPLTGTVEPANATNQDITWTITYAGETGVSLNGNTLTGTEKAGTVKVLATVKDGAAEGKDYTQEFQIAVGPWVKELIVNTEPAAKDTKLNVTAVIENPADGYKVGWQASSSNIQPTYSDIHQSTNRYTVTATVVFPNRDEAFHLSARITDSQSRDIDSERKEASIPGLPTISALRINNYDTGKYGTTAKQGSENELTLEYDWSGTFRWSLAEEIAGVALSKEVGYSNTLKVAETVDLGTVITVIVEVEENPKGGKTKQYTVIENSQKTAASTPTEEETAASTPTEEETSP